MDREGCSFAHRIYSGRNFNQNYATIFQWMHRELTVFSVSMQINVARMFKLQVSGT